MFHQINQEQSVNPKYKLIGCEIFYRELCFCAALSDNIVDLSFLPKGLHNDGQEVMSRKIQEEIDQVETSNYQAILLGYGLCNNGLLGLHSPLPLVVPRAHDCITLLLGSKEQYMEYFNNHPGTYFESSGWIERGDASKDSLSNQLGLSWTYDEYAAKYGEENAHYLMEMLGDGLKNYSNLAFIDMPFKRFAEYERQTQVEAQSRDWAYNKLAGSMDLLMRLVNGPWNEDDFLVVQPESRIMPSHDEGVVKAVE